jgi:hypothetical protein
MPEAEPGSVLDRLWIFTCAANSDFIHLRRRSVMTPAEGAFFPGVPNIIVVQSSAQEAPYGRLDPPFAQYLVALRPLKRVVWSVVGSGGFHSLKETQEVLGLARSTPNFTGVMLDDFFTGAKEDKRAKLTVEELGGIRRQLREAGSNLEIFVTLYTDKLDLPISDYLELVDVITLWTSDAARLEGLETSLKPAEAIAPRAKRMLGCHPWCMRHARGRLVGKREAHRVAKVLAEHAGISSVRQFQEAPCGVGIEQIHRAASSHPIEVSRLVGRGG